MIELNLPLPPSVNHYWKHARAGNGVKVYISPNGKSFQSEVIIAVLQAKARKQLAGKLQVEIVINPSSRRMTDLDNFLKSLLDAMTHAGVYLDDSQIDRLIVERGEIIKGGACFVRVTELEINKS